jgi:hypothetical protein
VLLPLVGVFVSGSTTTQPWGMSGGLGPHSSVGCLVVLLKR